MRKKLALMTALSLVVLACAAQTASASYIFVQVTPTENVTCQPTPESVRLFLSFKAKITVSGTSKPKKVRIGYQVIDRNTKGVLRSGVLNLKRSKGYKGSTPTYDANAEQQLSYHLNMSYKSGGKTKKLKKTYDSDIPSAAYLQSLGIPACA